MTELELLTSLGLAGLVPICGVVLMRRHAQRTWQQELVAYVLRFPRGLDPQAVVAFLSGLSGLAAAHEERPFVARAVVLETSATERGIQHHLITPRSLAHVVLSALRAAAPTVSARPDEDYRPTRVDLAAELGISDHGRSLATDRAAAVSNAVLASLQPLTGSQRLVMQWSFVPLGPRSLPDAAERVPAVVWAWEALGGTRARRPIDSEVVKAARMKQQAPVFAAVLRVGVVAQPASARSLVLRILAALHVANAPGVHLRRLGRSSARVARALTRHRLPLVSWPCTLNAAELAGLVAWPIGAVSLPGLVLGGARQLAPAADIPTQGRVVAEATFPGAERALALSVPDSLRHLHVIGPTGTGKSTLLLGLIAQDMAAGHGVVVIEPSGDLVSDVLDRVPAHRLKDVVVLDPADEARPVGLNVLSGLATTPELVVDQVVGIFHDLYRSSWGPRTDDILRAALLTLAHEPHATLVELPLLLTDSSLRRRLVGRVDDPVALEPFWGWFEALSEAERGQAIGPVMNKLRAFLLRRSLRNMLGQATSQFDLDQALAEQRIILAPLNKGVLGEEAAALVGALLVARLWQAVQRRSLLAAHDRPVTCAFVDEFQDFVRLPTSLADVLAQARKLGLGLTLAHQHLGQLTPTMREAVLANARSRVIFQTSADDARALARELAPYLEAADLQGLDAYEVVASLSTGGRVAPPVTARSLPAPVALGSADEARGWSRERYGVERQAVEAAIRTRHEPAPVAGPTGRREVRR